MREAEDVPSPSNYGGVGLLDTRTARFMPDGYVALSASLTAPDNRFALVFQGFPWAEFTFRYTINEAIRDPPLALHDRSFDLKIRLSEESEYVPALAIGFQDILGTGVYSGEYIVGSKRWGNLDFSLGIGWGRLATRGTFENPLLALIDSFRNRNDSSSLGGTILIGSLFHGPDLGLFGGISYRTPIKGLEVKLEYSSDAYEQEGFSGKDYSFPVNVGISYRRWGWLDVGLSFMHGKNFGLRVSTSFDPAAENWPVRLDTPPRFHSRDEAPEPTMLAPASAPAVPPRPAAMLPSIASRVEPAQPTRSTNTTTEMDAIATALAGQNLNALGIRDNGDTLEVLVENGRYFRDTDAVARAIRVLSGVAPAHYDFFMLTVVRAGQPLSTVTVPRVQIDKLANAQGSPAETWFASKVEPASTDRLEIIRPNIYPRFSFDVFPIFRQSYFDPDNPIYIELGAGITADAELARGLFVGARLTGSIYDTFDDIKRTANSALPHVRSDIAEYLKRGKYGIESLSAQYFFKLGPEVYARARGGYLESMFAGIGGEVLYRPYRRRLAVGIDLWAVEQRGFDRLFDLQHYRAVTGHVSIYYKLPWYDLEAVVRGGQYLARDRGVTLELVRRFKTGVRIGAWATFTDVPASLFGEGSFDKGIMITIPIEWASPFSSQTTYSLALRSIQRDGGQRLEGDATLYGMTDPSDYGAYSSEWNAAFRP